MRTENALCLQRTFKMKVNLIQIAIDYLVVYYLVNCNEKFNSKQHILTEN